MKIYNLLCFGFIPWGTMWKRNQSMVWEMAKLNFIGDVVFINPDVSLWQSIRHNILYKQLKTPKTTQTICSNIRKYTPIYLLPERIQVKTIQKYESRKHAQKIIRLNRNNPYILIMNCPNLQYTDVLDVLLENADLSIFDLSDDFVELVTKNKVRKRYQHNISKYVSSADLVFIINNHLKYKYGHLNKNCHIVRNGTNYLNFQRDNYRSIPLLDSLKSTKKPIIGYSGISNLGRIDTELLFYLLKEKPEWNFVFVGSQGEKLLAKFPGQHNLYHIPAVPYDELPDHIYYFDVAIVPFKINEHTRGNNLLKFHDYLAMGKPVVSTNIGGAKHLEKVIRIADSYASFLHDIEASLNDMDSTVIQKRKSVAIDNSWPNRIIEVAKIIQNHPKFETD